jgi:alpha-beta hydrolase superfamily lysophospholipase
MGNRLATEVKNHIIEFFPPDTLQRLSFIGHSLGGVIIRAALPRLLELKDKFHTLMTFSSPHIGYKVNASSVIEAGIWVLQKFKSSNCLSQLTMADSLNPR